MATQFGYGRVPDASFQGFQRHLRSGAWAAIAAAGGPLAALLLLSALRKLLDEAVEAIISAFVASVADQAPQRDAIWDQCQRSLAGILDVLELNPDPAISAAAGRVSGRVLSPRDTGKNRRRSKGLEHTKLKFAQEVSWGTMQVSLLDPKTDPQIAADIALLRLEPYFAAIADATRSLGEAVQTGTAAPYARVEAARTLCVTNFSAVHNLLDALLGTAQGEDLALLEALIEPLEALLDERQAPRPDAPPAAPTP